MPTLHDDEDDNDRDGLADSEFPDESDQDQEDESADDCPACGRAVYHDAERCPHCGQYISHTLPIGPKIKWIAIAILIAMGLGIIRWLF